MNLIWLSIISVALIVSAVESAVTQDAPSQVEPVLDAFRSKNFDEALRLTQSALARSPNSPKLWTLRGMAFSSEGKTTEAVDAFQHALKVSPGYLPPLEGASQALFKEHSQKAVPFLKQIVQQHPEDQVAHAMLGSLAFLRGDCKSAVAEFEQSHKQIDVQPAALLEYGACLAQSNQTEKAISALNGLLASNANNRVARRALAAIQLNANQPEEAIATLSPLLEGGDPDVQTARIAAAAYEANQDTPRAVAVLHDAIVRNPRNVDLYTDFADIAFSHQSFQVGVEMLNVGIQAEPNAAALYLARGVLFAQEALYDKAEADFDKAEVLDPHQAFSAAANDLLITTEHAGHPISELRRKLANDPNNAFLWSLQASLLSERAPAPGSPDFAEAVRSAKKAVALEPSLSSAYDALSKLSQQSGNLDEAIRYCRAAIRHDPKDQTAIYRLILLLRRTNDKAEIPDLVKKLAVVREEATRQEGEKNRYKLIIDSGADKSAEGPGSHQ